MKVSTFLAVMLGLVNLLALVYVCSTPSVVSADMIYVAVAIEGTVMGAFALAAARDLRSAMHECPSAVIGLAGASTVVCLANGLMLACELDVLRGEIARSQGTYEFLAIMSVTVLAAIAMHAVAAHPTTGVQARQAAR